MIPLGTNDVLLVHHALVEEFASSDDPIFPAGVKSETMLESAVARQAAGFGGFVKYSSVEGIAATLLYGLVNNHPFHNGNKRTGLVSTLVFLDKNQRSLDGTSHGELYWLVKSVASHTVCDGKRATPDREVEAIRIWIRRHSRAQETGEKLITYRELRRILQRFAYSLENARNNYIDITTQERMGFFGFGRSRTVSRMRIPYPGESSEVRKALLKHIRRTLRLAEEDGYDARAFYDDKTVVDAFIARYQTILRRLAKS